MMLKAERQQKILNEVYLRNRILLTWDSPSFVSTTKHGAVHKNIVRRQKTLAIVIMIWG